MSEATAKQKKILKNAEKIAESLKNWANSQHAEFNKDQEKTEVLAEKHHLEELENKLNS